jgi:transposase-like protein
MNCPHCQSQQVIKNGKHYLQDGTPMQNYLCKDYGKRFSERTGTPMARLRTPTSTVSIALKMRSEGMGVRSSGRVLDKSHSTILRWQLRISHELKDQCPLFQPFFSFPRNSQLIPRFELMLIDENKD